MKDPRLENNRLPQTKGSSEDHEDLISRLPDEILLEIIGHLLDHWSEHDSEKIRRTKLKQSITLSSGKQTIVYIYQHLPESPILTSWQAFSVVNRRIYSLCRPFVWKYLEFPSPLSGPMSFWRDEILSKHGSLVQVLDVKLRDEWSRIPDPPSIEQSNRDKIRCHYSPQSSHVNQIKFIEEDTDFWNVEEFHSDNLAVRGYTQDEGQPSTFEVSLESLVKLVSHCKKLTTLHLNLGHMRGDCHYPARLHDWDYNYTSLFCQLGYLQHLKILYPRSQIYGVHLSEALKHLSLLESLELTRLSIKDSTCLYDLKNLKTLVMDGVDICRNSWGCDEHPPLLKNPTICDCSLLPLKKVPCFLSFWAPHLTHLHIRVLEEPDRFPREDLSDYDPKCEQLTLPALTHLKIWPHSKCHYIHYFSNCKELYQLTFYDFIRREWDDELSGFFDLIPDDSFQVIDGLSDFIIKNEFPKLRWIILPVEHGNFPLDPIAASALFPLEEFCKSNGIKLIYLSAQAPRRDFL